MQTKLQRYAELIGKLCVYDRTHKPDDKLSLSELAELDSLKEDLQEAEKLFNRKKK